MLITEIGKNHNMSRAKSNWTLKQASKLSWWSSQSFSMPLTLHDSAMCSVVPVTPSSSVIMVCCHTQTYTFTVVGVHSEFLCFSSGPPLPVLHLMCYSIMSVSGAQLTHSFSHDVMSCCFGIHNESLQQIQYTVHYHTWSTQIISKMMQV